MRCCMYIATILALVSCERNEIVSFRNRGTHVYRQENLNVFKPQQNKQITSRDDTNTIIGGEYVMDMEEAPFMAFLVRIYKLKGQDMYGYCGATILSKKYLLSAAHCLQEGKPNSERHPANEYTAYVGGLSIKRSLDHATVKQYFIHTQFYSYDHSVDGKQEFRDDFDIAVIELAKELKFSSKISSVQLPPQLTTSGWTPKFPKRCIQLGIGWTSIHRWDYNLDTLLLKLAEVEIINPKNTTYYDCKELTKICIMDVAHNVNTFCHGDSGGPLMCDDIQEGITSYNSVCLPSRRAVNTRVEYFVDWINTIIKGN